MDAMANLCDDVLDIVEAAREVPSRTALIDKAVAGKARIGAVRFDLHPGLDNKSGDELFL